MREERERGERRQREERGEGMGRGERRVKMHCIAALFTITTTTYTALVGYTH